MGVWIETGEAKTGYTGDGVTPFVGVWIETISLLLGKVGVHSHTLRGCVD